MQWNDYAMLASMSMLAACGVFMTICGCLVMFGYEPVGPSEIQATYVVAGPMLVVMAVYVSDCVVREY